jgi:hypothetical protein
LERLSESGITQIYKNILNAKAVERATVQSATENRTLKKQIEEYEKQKEIDKKERYLYNIALKIDGYYSAWNCSKGLNHYLIGVKATFSASEKLFEKKAVKYYAKTPKECALKLLATAKNESNFTYNLICQNFKKDDKGLFITIYGYKLKKKEGFESILIKTSKDYGFLQVNEVNVNISLSKLKQLGLWDEKENKWLLHPETNSMMRILVDDERIRMKWNTPTNTNYNKFFLTMLEKVND